MGLPKSAPVVVPTVLSPLGKACARMDLTAVHDILLKTGYKDEEGAENEVLLELLFHQYSSSSMVFRTFESHEFTGWLNNLSHLARKENGSNLFGS